MKPGIHDLSNEDYHADITAISSSGLKLLLEPGGPAKFKHRYLDGIPSASKACFIFGEAFHMLTGEPDKFFEKFVPGPDLNKNTNKWKDFVKENSDKTILDGNVWDLVTGMADAVLANEEAQSFYSENGWVEKSIFWMDQETGIMCKARPDFLIIDGPLAGVMCDLKSAADASLRKWSRDAFKFGYHISAAHYTAGIEAETGESQPMHFTVAEKDAPHLVGHYHFTAGVIAAAERQRRKALQILKACRESGVWTGLPNENESAPVEMPDWMMEKSYE